MLKEVAVEDRVLAVFIDGLRPDGVDQMPFVRGLPEMRRLTTELGYSVTCHASMYTGLRPDRHKLWFVWVRDPAGSPFRGMRWLRAVAKVDSLPLRLAVQKVLKSAGRLKSGGFFGVPRIVHLPIRWWSQLSVAEDRLWWEDGYLPGSPTVFETLKAHGQTWAFAKPPLRPLADAPLRLGEAASKASVVYLFIGDVDAVSHASGQDSIAARDVLARVDAAISDAVAELEQIDGRRPTILLWSDHGHTPTRKVDPFQLARSVGIHLDAYLHVIDANFLRLWHDDPSVRNDLERRLGTLEGGRVLDEGLRREFRCPVDDRRWGDIIFYLDAPGVFSRTIWGFSRHMRSAHGYWPTLPDSDGVVVSNRRLRDGPTHIVDIAPTILSLVGIEPDTNLDGSSLLGVGDERPDQGIRSRAAR